MGEGLKRAFRACRMTRPAKWNPNKDAKSCVGCGQPFVKGDLIYHPSLTRWLNVHFRKECAEAYNHDLRELGLNH